MSLDRIRFLSNLIFMAYNDGTISPREQSVLEAAKSEFKFKKNEYSAALKSVEQGGFKITPIGSFSDQLLNLEWIIRVAFADDDLNEKESFLISEFAQKAGIYPEQLERIRSDALNALKGQSRLCPGCGAQTDSQAHFCHKCGASLEYEESIAIEMKIPSAGIAIEFPESTSASFPKALEIAKATDGFQTCQRNKKTWYLAVFPDKDLRKVIPLCESLSGMRNRRVYVEGQEMQWDEVFGFVWCAARRAAAYRPIEYCFGRDENRLNIWGCKQANMEWTEWARWFSYGRWEKTGFLNKKLQFRLDKQRIQHELATNLFKVRFCPHFRSDLITAVLKNLPDIVSPESDENWGYTRSYDQGPGAIKVIEKYSGYSIESWSDGVSPKGLSVFNDILLKSLKEIGSPPIRLE